MGIIGRAVYGTGGPHTVEAFRSYHRLFESRIYTVGPVAAERLEDCGQEKNNASWPGNLAVRVK